MAKRTLKEKQILNIVEDAVQEVFLPAMEKATPKDTGNTANSWRVITEGNTVYLANIKFGDIVRFLNDGTEPHTIRPKEKRSLRFVINNEVVFAKKVRHPGIEARKFVEETLNNNSLKNDYRKKIDNEIQKLLDDL